MSFLNHSDSCGNDDNQHTTVFYHRVMNTFLAANTFPNIKKPSYFLQ